MAEPITRGAAVVGLGIGTAHVRALRRLRDRFHLVAVCDPDPARSQPVAERTGAAVLSFDALLERDDIDVVHVCTPPSLHLAQCVAALAAGKHVVCEKPLVASLADVDALAAAEAGAAGRLMPVFQYRFGNGLQQVARARRRRPGRPGTHRIGRGGVAPAGRLLRGAMARSLGNGTGRRAALPGDPRA